MLSACCSSVTEMLPLLQQYDGLMRWSRGRGEETSKKQDLPVGVHCTKPLHGEQRDFVCALSCYKPYDFCSVTAFTISGKGQQQA